MNVLLVIWTVVGLSSGQSFGIPVYEWRPIGQFVSTEICENAAHHRIWKSPLMLVSELIKSLQEFPGDTLVEVNDNRDGECHSIEQVDFFPEDETCPVVIIQVNL